MDKIDYKPLVAIHCLVYNHEPYLRDCLEGFVMQQTNFPFVAIVHDDASTDGSTTIIREYEEKYPNIIKPIYETENQYSKHDGSVGRIVDAAIDATGAKYIAMCEGDDYWTDPQKLQKQVDFMEKNPEYSLCCHRYKIYNQNSDTWENDYVTSLFEANPEGFTFGNKDNFETWITKTMTLVYRADCLPAEYLTIPYKYSRDVHLNYHLLLKGKGYCLPFDGAVYRRQDGGTFSALTAMDKSLTSYLVYADIAKYNPNDVELQLCIKTLEPYTFDNIRRCIQNRQYSKVFRQAYKEYTHNQWKTKGLKGIFCEYKKLALSWLRGLKK